MAIVVDWCRIIISFGVLCHRKFGWNLQSDFQ